MRRGFALSLPLSVGLLVLLSLVAMAQLFRSGQALEEAAWDAGGAACEEAATSAVEEASWRLQRALTDPAEPLYWHVRRELVRGHRAYLDISTDVDPKHLRTRLADPALPPLFRAMRIDHFKVVWHVPLKASGEQLVDFDCGVSLDLAAHRVYRRACERRRYGVVHVSPPKPFDQMTLAIADHGFLRELPRIRNRWRQRFLGAQTVGERLEWLREVLTNGVPGRARGLTGQTTQSGDQTEISFAPPFQFAKAPPRMPTALFAVLQKKLAERKQHDRGVDDRLARMTPEERGWEEWRIVQSEPEAQLRFTLAARDAPRRGEAFPRTDMGLVEIDLPGPDSVVFAMTPTVDLAEFDYEVRLREYERAHEKELEQAMQEVNELWVSYLERSPMQMNAATFLQLEIQLLGLFKRMHPAMTKHARYLRDLVTHVGRHTRNGLTSGALEAYLRRSSKRLKAFGLHADEQDDLDRALKAYPTFNGHLSLSGHKPVVLDAKRFSGKALISVRAERNIQPERLTLKALRRSTPSDLAVVNAPLVHLSNEPTDAAIVVGDRLSLAGPADVTGSLFLRRLAPLADRRPEEELKGQVTYDPLVTSGTLLERKTTAQEPEGFGLDHLVVTLCPRGAERVVRRAPPAGEGN